MTEEDQNAAIGRLMMQLTEAKTRRAALLSEAETLSKTIDGVATALRQLTFKEAFWDGRETGQHRSGADFALDSKYPDGARLTTLLDDLRAVSAELRRCRRLIKEAGIVLE